MFFPWKYNLDGSGPPKNIDIWKTSKGKTNWAEPYKLSSPVNTEKFDSWPSYSKDNTLYFFSTRDGGLGRADLYRSKLIDGKYSTVENLGENINTEFFDHDPCIAPDESFLIWCSNKPGEYGKNDLFISYRQQDNSWTPAINMSEMINSSEDETRPYITQDGEYLFFIRDKSGNKDIYWADAKIIEKLKPDYLK